MNIFLLKRLYVPCWLYFMLSLFTNRLPNPITNPLNPQINAQGIKTCLKSLLESKTKHQVVLTGFWLTIIRRPPISKTDPNIGSNLTNEW